MHYVYLLKSKSTSSKTYIGYTQNLKSRLKAHNDGLSKYTRDHTPWELESYIAVKDKGIAMKLESYLKTNSGRAFINKRLKNPNKGNQINE